MSLWELKQASEGFAEFHTSASAEAAAPINTVRHPTQEELAEAVARYGG